jgi:hypothetical protein
MNTRALTHTHPHTQSPPPTHTHTHTHTHRLHAPPKKHSKHWESPLYFPLSTEVTAHHINATMDDNECFDLALKSFQTRINKRYFAKLRALYYGSKGVTGAKDDDDMLDRAYCMLARYEVTPQSYFLTPYLSCSNTCPLLPRRRPVAQRHLRRRTMRWTAGSSMCCSAVSTVVSSVSRRPSTADTRPSALPSPTPMPPLGA